MRPPLVAGSIVPFNTPQTTTYREVDAGVTSWAVIVIICVIGGLVNLLSTRKWWLYPNMWSYARIVTLWFWSIALFATATFVIGEVDRLVMAAATLHLQVEILLCCLLLGLTAGASMTISFLFGIITYSCAIGLSDLRTTFLIDSFVGYGIDLYHIILLLYGRRWIFALGAASHGAAAAITFYNFVLYPGAISDSLSGFLTAAFTVLFTTAGVMLDRRDSSLAPSPGQRSIIQVLANRPALTVDHVEADAETPASEKETSPTFHEAHVLGYLRNPMSNTRITPTIALGLWALALTASAAISFPLNFVLSGSLPDGTGISQDTSYPNSSSIAY